MQWTTLITTPDYAEGVICLAQSLLLVKSRATLLCYITTADVSQAITQSANRCPGFVPPNLTIKYIPNYLYDSHFVTDSTKDWSCFIDAPRRFLFLLGEPFIFLDADIIAVQNFDEIIELIGDHSEDDSIFAVPNFRNKKKGYGDSTGNFNAGLMIVPKPLKSDYDKMVQMLKDGYNDTEEKLLNEIFRNRWNCLPISYNCQKRAFKLAPVVWNEVKNSELGIKIIHYVGGKPWQSAEDLKRLDWEASSDYAMIPYVKLFNIWHLIRDNLVDCSSDCITACNRLKSIIPSADM